MQNPGTLMPGSSLGSASCHQVAAWLASSPLGGLRIIVHADAYPGKPPFAVQRHGVAYRHFLAVLAESLAALDVPLAASIVNGHVLGSDQVQIEVRSPGHVGIGIGRSPAQDL